MSEMEVLKIQLLQPSQEHLEEPAWSVYNNNVTVQDTCSFRILFPLMCVCVWLCYLCFNQKINSFTFLDTSKVQRKAVTNYNLTFNMFVSYIIKAYYKKKKRLVNVCVCVVLGIKSRASCMLDKCSTTELLTPVHYFVF
jgi:hypothetical protein